MKDFVREIFDMSAQIAEWYTAPILFLQNERGVHDRTGVFLQIGEMRFLITAAHNFANAINAGLPAFVAPIGPGGQPAPVTGRLAQTNSQADIAVIHLSEASATAIGEGHRFLGISDIMPRKHEAHNGATYVITGYPHAMQAHDAKGQSFVEVWRYVTGAYSGDYDDVQDYNPEWHLILGHDREARGIRDGKVIDPPGLSGCGVWFVCNWDTYPYFTASDMKLVGIQTAWRKSREYAKAAWIEVALEAIWIYFPEARPAMRLHGIDIKD